ncbi:unnamed protein product [Lepeophtheirus salmonis]|uniref:(salmon louse) hypothetical protein n=1 Tax=Lepeophtheirus salmonis TaxID=72036 RepID=A0A7R8CI57_LEPSM|nr:unnamed protein product [Lepeophtheirus salmonis]CAF2829305.1 unnamed protein product [Lepeophtheirus salmonis]
MVKVNPAGHMKLDDRFVTANTQIKCDASWTSEVFDNFESYVNGKMKTSTMGFGIEVLPELSMNLMNGLVSNKFPPLFSRSWSQSNDVEKMKDFFKKDRGSITVSQATCITHKVDIADKSIKHFVDPFIDSVKSLHGVTSKSDKVKKVELKRFINEFGTHYGSTSEMGTKLLIERRYSLKERSHANENELKVCNTLAGAEVFGFRVEKDKGNCSNDELKSNTLNSKFAERMVVSTYGSFISNDLISWSKQVISLVQGNSFSPRVIKRELRSILHLFEDQNFTNLTDKNGNCMNISNVLKWVHPMMQDYCGLFELNCNSTGCGINDNCTVEEWCVEDVNDYYCVTKNISISLGDGLGYIGEVGSNLQPHGKGKEYYSNGNIKFDGHYINVLENILYNGKFHDGKFLRGTIYKDNGEVLTQLNGSTGGSNYPSFTDNNFSKIRLEYFKNIC